MLLESCVAFRFRSHPFLVGTTDFLASLHVILLVVVMLLFVGSKSFLHFGFFHAYIYGLFATATGVAV